MAITTYRGRARRAWLNKTHSVYWLAVGRTTPWTDEYAPPSPSPGYGDIQEAIVFTKAEFVSLCKIVTTGSDVTVKGQTYAYVADEDGIYQFSLTGDHFYKYE